VEAQDDSPRVVVEVCQVTPPPRCENRGCLITSDVVMADPDTEYEGIPYPWPAK
jgi:hypothetical protein